MNTIKNIDLKNFKAPPGHMCLTAVADTEEGYSLMMTTADARQAMRDARHFAHELPSEQREPTFHGCVDLLRSLTNGGEVDPTPMIAAALLAMWLHPNKGKRQMLTKQLSKRIKANGCHMTLFFTGDQLAWMLATPEASHVH